MIGLNGGGIIGSEASYATITNCYSTRAISDGGGGICGNICGYDGRTVTITNCYSEGSIAANAGGIGGANTGNVSISNCYSLGSMVASTSGGIIGATTSTAFAIRNCYTVGTVTGLLGYIIGSSYDVPLYCYAEALILGGTWSSANTLSILLGRPSPIVGTTWVATVANQPYELFNMGYTPYTADNIINSIPPALNRSMSDTITVGDSTINSSIIEGKSYTILQVTGGAGTITMDPITGIISTTAATVSGIYTIYLRNVGSYNITEYELTVTEIPIPTPSTASIQPCCTLPIFRRGPLVNNTTYTALVAGNTYVGSVRRGTISYAQIIAMKKATASK